MKTTRTDYTRPLQRRDLVTVLAYVNRTGRSRRCVDGSFGDPEMDLNRLAAAAGMQ